MKNTEHSTLYPIGKTFNSRSAILSPFLAFYFFSFFFFFSLDFSVWLILNYYYFYITEEKQKGRREFNSATPLSARIVRTSALLYYGS